MCVCTYVCVHERLHVCCLCVCGYVCRCVLCVRAGVWVHVCCLCVQVYVCAVCGGVCICTCVLGNVYMYIVLHNFLN